MSSPRPSLPRAAGSATQTTVRLPTRCTFPTSLTTASSSSRSVVLPPTTSSRSRSATSSLAPRASSPSPATPTGKRTSAPTSRKAPAAPAAATTSPISSKPSSRATTRTWPPTSKRATSRVPTATWATSPTGWAASCTSTLRTSRSSPIPKPTRCSPASTGNRSSSRPRCELAGVRYTDPPTKGAKAAKRQDTALSEVSFVVRDRLASRPVQVLRLGSAGDNGRLIEEGVAIADDRLGDELVAMGGDARVLADRGADRHDLDQAAAQLGDEHLDADHAIGPQLLGLEPDVVQTVLSGVVDQAGDLADLAPGE